MAAASGTASESLQPALPVFATPSTIGPESVSDILSDVGDLPDPADVTMCANGHNIISDTKVDGHAISASSSPTSASDIATPSNNAALGHVSTSPSQGRYDNTVNEYDLVKEASRAKGIKSRTVCVAIPVNRKDGTVLMVTSRKHDTKWIFPKGGHEKGETYAEAAVRESWEEAGTSPTLVLTEPEVYKASSLSGDGERKIHYHIFEMEVTPEDLVGEWPEASQRNREFCTIPKALERCAAWANEKNTKLELVIGFRKTRVFQEWHAANPHHQSTILMDGDSTIASAKESSSFASLACNTVTNHPQDADNGDLIEAKKRRGVGTDSSVEEEAPKSGLLEKVLGFIHPTKTQ